MRLIKIFTLILFLAAVLIGQTNKGSITGIVTDQKGAAVPGATVTITSIGTNQKITLTTSDTGNFTASSLEPVAYNVIVEAASFKKVIISTVKVDTSSTSTVNVTLEVGDVAEQVTVDAGPPTLNTDSGTTGQTITERQLEDVPLNNRSVLDLAVTIPNVSGDVDSEDPAVTSNAPVPGFNLSLNGGRPGSTAILADGVNNTGVGIARQVVSLTPETVQEFTVQTSAYSAEFGQTAGGVINATTKSGTNRLNGTGLVYHRNPSTNAQKWVNGAVRTPNRVKTTQLSFAVGGPVFLPAVGEGGPMIYDGRDKTFFFFAVEPRWRKDFLVVDTLLPTAAERAGDFRGLVRTNSGWLPASVAAQYNQTSIGQSTIYNQYVQVNGQLQRLAAPGTNQRYCQFGETTTIVGSNYCSTTVATQDARNIIPSALFDPVALKAIQYIPDAGGYYLNGGGTVSNFLVNRFVKQDEVRYTGRIDHAITKNNRANFRFTIVPATGLKGFGSDINGNGASYSNSKQYVATDNHVFSPTLINELRLGYTTGTFSDDFTPEFSINGGRNLSTELGLPSLTSGGLPLFTFTDGFNAFANIGSSGSTNNYNKEKRYTLTDIVYWNQGNKSWKFGVDLGDAKLNVIPFAFGSGGAFTFRTGSTAQTQTTSATNGGHSIASFLLGIANTENIRSRLIPYDYDWRSYAAFVQNDWKVRPNLTVNLGLRYQLQMPRTEKNDIQGTFRPDLAQSFTLPTPITLSTGRVITTALVPPFAFAGRGGRSRYLYDPDYNGWEPRFGFAWSPNSIFGFGKSENRRIVIRGGYGISHASLTGNNRLPNPDLGAFNQNAATATATGSTGTAFPQYALRLSSNPGLQGISLLDVKSLDEVNTALGIPSDGLVYLGSLAIPSYAIPGKPRTPYIQNWNLTASREVMKNTVVEIAYVGSKGTHLMNQQININPRDFNYVQSLDLAASSTETAVVDPLGRKSLINAAISVTQASLGSKYLGFDTLNSFFDTSANSIRHAGYIDVRRRVTNGLALTANYTFGKSIDEASDASPDKNVLSSGNTQGSNVSFGATRLSDRAISNYDVKHTFSSTFIWDIPVGAKRRLFAKTWAPLDAVIGGWTISGVFRLQGGYPFLPTIADGNTIGTLTHTVRPDIVSGVPLVNPRYNSNCKASALCEPYINPAAFMRPIKGQLGNAPRSLDVRGPMLRFFDMSFQKNFKLPFGLSNDGKRRFQLRVDMNNVFNHPNFRIAATSAGGAPDFMGAPTETSVTLAEYNAWATFNGKSTFAVATDPAFVAIQNAARPLGVLPLNFFNVPLPEGFGTVNVNSFDITTQSGFKLYRLKQAYGVNGNNWGQLRELGTPRYIQFALKLYF
jgi:Carboxypeptidase regulatory-like domain